jgi:hypothetical protein
LVNVQLYRDKAILAPGGGAFDRRGIFEAANSLIENPDTGDLIPGSGGVRKLRWAFAGRGKRGGLRIIYYAQTRQGRIWMLTLYAKNVTENISANVLRQIKEAIDD